MHSPTHLFPSALLSILFSIPILFSTCSNGFEIREANIDQIQSAFNQNKLTSRELVEFYLKAIKELNPLLRAVIEVNPDALYQAQKADQERKRESKRKGGLHGIPVQLKDNIATKDRLNTTAGSLALLGSVVPRDAGVVSRLRKAGAIILGKASLSEWAHFRAFSWPSGWCARRGQAKNPYVLSEDPCGSSTGSAVAVAANMVTVSLGTETDGSILCPSSANSVVGIKPTLGLTSRAGVIPISPRQDTVGPMCRSVLDAVYVLDEIVGFDKRDEEATSKAAKFIPAGGYKQFLKVDGLRGKRIGILRNSSIDFSSGQEKKAFRNHLTTLRKGGATMVDNLEISLIISTAETTALLHEFKRSLNSYLSELLYSPVRSLSDVIAFNEEHPIQVKFALEYPRQGLLPRLESRSIVKQLWPGDDRNRKYLQLAKMDLEACQKLYQDEIKQLLSWFSEVGFDTIKFARQDIVKAYFTFAAAIYEPEFSFFRVCFGKLGYMTAFIDDIYDLDSMKLQDLKQYTHAFLSWDPSYLVGLPEFMIMGYNALNDTIMEVAEESNKIQGRDMLPSIRETWEELIGLYMKEAEWQRTGYIMGFNEYLEVASTSIAGTATTLSTVFLTGKVLSDDMLSKIGSGSRFLYLVGCTARLSNDIVTFKREQAQGKMTSGVSCYMRDNPNCSQEEAIAYLRSYIESSLQELELELFQSIATVPECCSRVIVNFTRASVLMCKRNDGFSTHDDEDLEYLVKDYLYYPLSSPTHTTCVI